MRYPIAIETGDAKHTYGVVVPDLPGCFSAGDTLADSLQALPLAADVEPVLKRLSSRYDFYFPTGEGYFDE
jgi:hypothetical protein